MSGLPLDIIRYAADTVLAIVPPQLQVRPYTITMETTNWSGSRIGLGTKTITSELLFNGSYPDGYAPVKYRQLSQRDVVVSGGLLKDGDVVIGPLVFPYDTGTITGGLDVLNLSPPATGVNEVLFRIIGPNYPTEGVLFEKIWAQSDKNVMYRVYLRSTGNEG